MNEFIKYDFDSDINIYPVFDVHYGSVNHCEREFRDYIKIIKDDPNGYAILGGDLINNNIGGKMIPWEDTASPHIQIMDMVELLRPLAEANRILVSVRGNHEFRTTRHSYIDSSAIIMGKLNLEERYRPDIAFLSIGVGKRSHGNRGECAAHRFVIGVTHGFGGGIKQGTAINRAIDYWSAYEGVDVCILGHTHKMQTSHIKKTVLDRRKGSLSYRNDYVVIASPWLDGSSYAVQKGYPPVVTCMVQRITLHAPIRTDVPGDIEYAERTIGRALWERM